MLRTFQVTGNTRLKVSLEFLLSLRILRYTKTLFKRQKTTFSGVEILLGCCNGLCWLRTQGLGGGQ